ncbi:metallophosphoesterase family protein [Parvularcula lutaonensis]|uniref:Exonuclease SbcCD subunit D n=1 Tax=Parvularcula lutaonensis TaxID=491923 RepID=A0ABV7MCU3_9PROT|nr:DNA repair exonuclease [Parvularcula lutaonensis]GGY51040.1 exonuclease [Parvularcula lutaonensis]
MGFRFVHTADWQLGKPFGRFGPEKAALLQQARQAIPERIAKLARDEGASHVLVAGDVWDQEVPADRVLRQPLDRMADASDLTWWLLPGNHDPAKEEGLWDRLRAFGVPENVRLLTEAVPQEMEQGITLLPAPWHSKRPGRDLTAWFGGEGTLIGLAHGSVQDFSSRADGSAVIAKDRADQAGLAYLALGDWHGMREAGPRAWYPGTPEPDNFRQNDQGHALVVDLDTPNKPVAHATGIYDWLRHEVVLEDLSSIDSYLPDQRALDRTLLRLKLTGAVSFADRAALEEKLALEEGRFFTLEVDWAGVETRLDEADLDERLGDGMLRRVADRLIAMDGHPEAAEALRLLDRMLRD